jgi:hypothetical protein
MQDLAIANHSGQSRLPGTIPKLVVKRFRIGAGAQFVILAVHGQGDGAGDHRHEVIRGILGLLFRLLSSRKGSPIVPTIVTCHLSNGLNDIPRGGGQAGSDAHWW